MIKIETLFEVSVVTIVSPFGSIKLSLLNFFRNSKLYFIKVKLALTGLHMNELMATLQERMEQAKKHYETNTGRKFKNTDLAAFVKVSKPSIGQWFNGPTNKLEGSNLVKAAEFFGVNPKWLAGYNVPMLNKHLDNNVDIKEKISLEGRLIPVISWVQAGAWTGIESVPEGTEFEEWLPYNKDCGPNGYALIVEGLSMAPKFEPGDRIYVNPDIATFDLKTNDLVIVSCNGDNEATFKKLIIEGSVRYLEALNPMWPNKIIELTDECKLVAKVVGLYRKI